MPRNYVRVADRPGHPKHKGDQLPPPRVVDTNAPPRAAAPKRRPPGGTPKLTQTQVTSQCGLVIAVANGLAAEASPQWRTMPLTEQEIGRLANAAAAEVMRSERLQALLSGAAQLGPHASLMIAVAAVAIPRLGISVPQQVRDAIGVDPNVTVTPAVPVETGGAHGGDGGHGVGQVPVGVPSYPPMGGFGSFQEQIGRREVPGANGQNGRAADVRSTVPAAGTESAL